MKRALIVIMGSVVIALGIALCAMSFYIAFMDEDIGIIRWAALLSALMISILFSCIGGFAILYNNKKDGS